MSIYDEKGKTYRIEGDIRGLSHNSRRIRDLIPSLFHKTRKKGYSLTTRPLRELRRASR